MKSIDVTPQDSYNVDDSMSMTDATERMKQILDAKYQPADLDQVIADCTHLNEEERDSLKQLLQKYKGLFDGSLGNW